MNIAEAEKIIKNSFLFKDANEHIQLKEAISIVLQALENSISKDNIKEKIEEQTKRIDKLLEDVVDKSIGCINVSYLSKKEKEEVINKRNCLLVQKATLQQVKEELLKGE
ncbi:MAG: hypothetical protein IJX99_02045 [Clostridia bacterium]|nr:hypothetical protein [Clostridia bacterium]